MYRLKRENIISIVIFFCMISQVVSSIVGQWWMFLLDIIILVGGVASISHFKYKYCKAPIIIFSVLLTIDVISILSGKSGMILGLWGIRSQYRFFLFFLICITVGSVNNINQIMRVLNKFLYLNIVLVSIQFFACGIKGDYLGGFFGTNHGCNGITNIFLCIVSIYTIVSFLNNNIGIKLVIINSICSLYWATLAELKIYYIEFIVIIVIASIISRSVSKMLIVICVALMGLIASGMVLPVLFPSFEKFFHISYMIFYFKRIGYGSYGFNRYTAFEVINNYIFSNSAAMKFCGMGIGNGETGPISALVSPAYMKYVVGMNIPYYGYFHSAIYMEHGFIGVFMYIAFFASIFIFSYKEMKKSKCVNKTVYCQTAMIFSVICVIAMYIDSSLKTAVSGMLAYWVLSWGYQIYRERVEQENDT